MATDGMPKNPDRPARGRLWGEIAVRFANRLAAEGFPRGDLAELRRMNLDTPDAAAFWRLMAWEDLLGCPATERKWALVLHGLALMTRTAGNDAMSRSAHDWNVPIGEALFYGDDRVKETAFYSEPRLNRLLTARGPMLRTLLARLFRMLGAKGCTFDWYQMAQMILCEGDKGEQADGIRQSIARAYYWAESQAIRAQVQEGNA